MVNFLTFLKYNRGLNTRQLQKRLHLKNKITRNRIFFLYYLLKLSKIYKNKKKSLVVYKKSVTLINRFLKVVFFIHNGRIFKPIKVERRCFGLKFGEFVFTRRFGRGESIHLNKKKIKIKKKLKR